MCGYLHRFSVLVLLSILQGYSGWPSSINIESYKPYSWDSKSQMKSFDNIPQLPCPTKNLQLCVCKSDLKNSWYLVDCQGKRFNDQIIYRLQVPPNTTHFNTAGNFFNTIHNGTFENATSLIYLDLSSNYVDRIESHAIAELQNLTVLDLSHNSIKEPAVFLRPLSSLQVLSFIEDEFTYPIKYIVDGISESKYLEKLAIATNYISRENVRQLRNTPVTYLSINNVFRTPPPSRLIQPAPVIERGAFSSWKSLKTLELNYMTSLGSRSNDVFRNLSGLHVVALYIKSGLYGAIRFDGFEAPNLKALAMNNNQVHFFDFDSFSVPTVQWLDISHNTIGWVRNPILHQLYYLDMSSQTPIEQCTILEFGTDSDTRSQFGNLTFVDLSGVTLCYEELGFTISCYSHVKYVNLRHSRLTALTGPDDICKTSYKVDFSYIDLQDNDLQCVNSTFLAQYDW